MLKGLSGKKNRHKLTMLNALSLIDAEIEYKNNRSMQSLRNFVLAPMYMEIPFMTQKSVIALFLAEVLNKSIREEESNYYLFDFIKTHLIALDHLSVGIANFHLYFLVKLTRFLGFVPQQNVNISQAFFNLQSGKFGEDNKINLYMLSHEESLLLNSLLSAELNTLNSLKINRSLRRSFLEKWMEYYRLHLEGFGEIKGLKVLNDLFD